MSKILIIGSSGFIGQSLLKFNWQDHTLICPSSNTVDITNNKMLEQAIAKADIVLNLAAYTNTKFASLNKIEPAWQTNFVGAKNISKFCHMFNKHLIHISTNAVFPNYLDDKKYKDEKIIIAPNVTNSSPYGYTKLLGEIEALKNINTTVLRISYPFGNVNFEEKDYILKLLKAIKSNVSLFDDQFINLTYISQLHNALMTVIKDRKMGVFHIVSRDESTPYDIYRYLDNKLDLNANIKPASVKSIGNSLYSSNEAISTTITEQSLNLKAPSLFDGIENFIESNKKFFSNQR